jgi:L-ascorbate metabolism protein UlaG (beta-lactamase superfamily)
MWKARRWLFPVLITLIVVAAAAAWLHRKWQEQPPVSALGWPIADASGPASPLPAARVTVTWLGITTLLFDDGETQILVDGTFSRPSLADVLLQRRVWSDAATINRVLAEFRLNRLAAIVPVHSHFDHAMDAGLVANRTSAMVLGSESTANIARGAGVPVSQYQILADGESRQFGAFTITLLASRHAPLGPGDEEWFEGVIEEPLRQPARIMDWRTGLAWSVFVAHPQGTTLVQGSAGFIERALPVDSADVVMLGVAGLSGLGPDYTARYWAETVQRTGASRVYPVHYEDFTRPFGEVALFPTLVDDTLTAASWIDELAAESEIPVIVRRLPFGEPVALYADGPGGEAAP